jgi:hypothetical protein
MATAQKKRVTRKPAKRKTVSLKPAHKHLGHTIARLRKGRTKKAVDKAQAKRNADIDRTIKILEGARKALCGRGGICGPDMAVPV